MKISGGRKEREIWESRNNLEVQNMYVGLIKTQRILWLGLGHVETMAEE